MSKALFIYFSEPSSSRADSLHYVGLLAEGQGPMELVRPYLMTKRPGIYPEDLDAMLEEGEIYHAVLDLSQPGLFLTSFEHEDGDWRSVGGSLMRAKVQITKETFEAV